MKISKILFTLILSFGVYGVAFAAPTSTTVQNLFISGIKPNSGTSTLIITSSGLVSTSTGGSSSGGLATSTLGQFTPGNCLLVLNSSTAIAFDGCNYNSSTDNLTVGTSSVTRLRISGSVIDNLGGGGNDLRLTPFGGNIVFNIDGGKLFLGGKATTTLAGSSDATQPGFLCIGDEAGGAQYCLNSATSTGLGFYNINDGKQFFIKMDSLTDGVVITPPATSGTWALTSDILASSTWLKVANNLSDLNSTSSARTNIGYSGISPISISSTGTIIFTNPGYITTSTYNASITVATVAPLGGGGSLTDGGTLSLTCTTCITSPTSPGGSDTYIQFNNAGAFGGVSTLTWNSSTLNFSSPTGTFSGRVVVPLVLGSTGSGGSLTLQSTEDTTRGTVDVERKLRVHTGSSTTGGGVYNFIDVPLDVTQNGVNPSFRILLVSGSTTYTTNPNVFGAGSLFNFNGTVRTSGTIAMSALTAFANSAILSPDINASTTGFSTNSFLDNITYTAVTNASATAPFHRGVSCTNVLNTGWRITDWSCLRVTDPTGTGSEITSMYGIEIVALTGRSSTVVAGINSAITSSGTVRYFLRSTGNAPSSLGGSLYLGTTTPNVASGTLHVLGNVQLSGSSTVITPSIGGGALLAGQCASATSSIDTAVTSSTAAFITTPQNYPGDGSDWYSYLSAPGELTTKACAIVALTPAATSYVVKILK